MIIIEWLILVKIDFYEARNVYKFRFYSLPSMENVTPYDFMAVG